MQRLSGADASFVYGETPNWHMHLGTLAVLDPSTAPDGFNADRLRSLVEAKGNLNQAAQEWSQQARPGLDQRAQPICIETVWGGRRVEHSQRAQVHVPIRCFPVDETGVRTTEPLHSTPPSTRCDRTPAPGSRLVPKVPIPAGL